MAVTRDAELVRFKVEIDLRAYAEAEHGYRYDRKESWRGSAVLRHEGTDDKIVVSRSREDRHYVYFSVRDDHDNGSIIDFLQKRRRSSLGEVRMALRPWIGRPPSPSYPALEPIGRDRVAVDQAFRRMEDAPEHPYLTGERGLSPALLGSARFAGRVKIDGRGNAVFPHFDALSVCGYEIKNRGYTAFSSGGEKGLWVSRTERTDTVLVIAESAIDALSHAALFPDARARYASIGGQMNTRQPDVIKLAALRLAEGARILAAVDQDAEGARLAGLLRQTVEATGRGDLMFGVHQPEGVKDWNDVLRQRETSSFPTALPCPKFDR